MKLLHFFSLGLILSSGVLMEANPGKKKSTNHKLTKEQEGVKNTLRMLREMQPKKVEEKQEKQENKTELSEQVKVVQENQNFSLKNLSLAAKAVLARRGIVVKEVPLVQQKQVEEKQEKQETKMERLRIKAAQNHQSALLNKPSLEAMQAAARRGLIIEAPVRRVPSEAIKSPIANRSDVKSLQQATLGDNREKHRQAISNISQVKCTSCRAR